MEIAKFLLASVAFFLLIPSGILIGLFFLETITSTFVLAGFFLGLIILACAFGETDGGKHCSACKKAVPNSSRAGMHCPHCGAYWSREEMIR